MVFCVFMATRIPCDQNLISRLVHPFSTYAANLASEIHNLPGVEPPERFRIAKLTNFHKAAMEIAI